MYEMYKFWGVDLMKTVKDFRTIKTVCIVTFNAKLLYY